MKRQRCIFIESINECFHSRGDGKLQIRKRSFGKFQSKSSHKTIDPKFSIQPPHITWLGTAPLIMMQELWHRSNGSCDF